MNLYASKISSTPGQFASRLRERGPVFWAETERIWVVTDHTLAQQMLKSDAFSADRSSFVMSQMSGCPFSKVANFFGVVKKMMVTSDGEDHARRRKLAAAGISDHVLDGFQPEVRRVVGSLLDGMKGGRAEFVAQVARPLPNIVLADLFSIPADERADFERWANHMTQFFGGGSEDLLTDAVNADTGAAQLSGYLTGLIHERRIKPQGDFISHLLGHQEDLDDSEVIAQAAIMLVAGTVTTTDQICNNLVGMLESGGWEQVVQNPTLLDTAIEEATRLDPAVNFIFRMAKQDVSLGAAQVKAGEMVFVSSHAVNRQEDIFSEADAFLAGRKRNPHFGFGSGPHFCLGARLGRIQMRELFGQMRERFPKLRLDGEPVRKHQSLGFSGFSSLPLAWGEE